MGKDKKNKDKNKEKKKIDKSTVKIIVIIVVILLLMIAIGVISVFYLNRIPQSKITEFENWISSLGIIGWLLLLCLQMLQIFIAFIPGEPIELIAGALYGGFGGLLLCMIGCIIASSGVFMLSKRFGGPLLAKLFKKKELDEYAFIKDSKKRESIVFILFLIPGTPKDMLTYVIGATPMKLGPFLVLSSIARIPSVVSSTFLGSSLLQGNWVTAIILLGVIAVIGILGIMYKDKMIDAAKNISRKFKERKKRS